ncbi:hypothetical protein SGZLLDDJ_CDS_0016 [Mycoplasmopsis phage vB_Mfe_PMF329]|nr:hypothetical protein SGZLLDDJ_CDS_0016 [Mycoplasmopsis phage vB_Mfe_PMF329]
MSRQNINRTEKITFDNKVNLNNGIQYTERDKIKLISAEDINEIKEKVNNISEAVNNLIENDKINNQKAQENAESYNSLNSNLSHRITQLNSNLESNNNDHNSIRQSIQEKERQINTNIQEVQRNLGNSIEQLQTKAVRIESELNQNGVHTIQNQGALQRLEVSIETRLKPGLQDLARDIENHNRRISNIENEKPNYAKLNVSNQFTVNQNIMSKAALVLWNNNSKSGVQYFIKNNNNILEIGSGENSNNWKTVLKVDRNSLLSGQVKDYIDSKFNQANGNIAANSNRLNSFNSTINNHTSEISTLRSNYNSQQQQIRNIERSVNSAPSSASVSKTTATIRYLNVHSGNLSVPLVDFNTSNTPSSVYISFSDPRSLITNELVLYYIVSIRVSTNSSWNNAHVLRYIVEPQELSRSSGAINSDTMESYSQTVIASKNGTGATILTITLNPESAGLAIRATERSIYNGTLSTGSIPIEYRVTAKVMRAVY